SPPLKQLPRLLRFSAECIAINGISVALHRGGKFRSGWANGWTFRMLNVCKLLRNLAGASGLEPPTSPEAGGLVGALVVVKSSRRSWPFETNNDPTQTLSLLIQGFFEVFDLTFGFGYQLFGGRGVVASESFASPAEKRIHEVLGLQPVA